MKKLYIIIFTTIFVVFSFTQVLSNDKIFFVDLEYLINNTNIGKKTLTKINKLNEENLSKLKNKETELRTNKMLSMKFNLKKKLILLK